MLDRNLPRPRFYLAKNFADTCERFLGYFLLLESNRFQVCTIIDSFTTVEIPVFTRQPDEFWLDGVGESAENLPREDYGGGDYVFR